MPPKLKTPESTAITGIQGGTPEMGRMGRRSPKASKGTVKVASDRGRLRLRFQHGGKRYSIGTGLIGGWLPS